MKRALPITLGLLVGALLPTGQAEEATKPNVVIVVCDDFNPYYTGFAGDPDSETPHLDALAQDSAVFSRCYTASTVCMPARTSLVTGLYPHNTGCWGNTEDLFVSPKLTTMFQDFRQAGYATAMIGKTHWYSGPGFKDQFESKMAYFDALGIDQFWDVATTFGSRTGSGIYQDFLREHGLFEKQSADLTERLRENQYVARPSLLQPEQTCDWMMTDLALEYFDQSAEAQPFALMIGYSNPHSPFDPSGEYADAYDPASLSLRSNVRPFKKYGTDYSEAEIQKARAAYLGKIRFLDDLVGRLIDDLKSRGLWENTVFVFTADHGMSVGEHGNIAKGQFWEEVARVPMVFRAPGLTDGGIESDALVQMFDLYPTVVELMGGTTSPQVRARSFLPVLNQSTTDFRDAVFSEIHHDNELGYMVRTDRYKWFIERGEESLFDLETDPFEQSNLIGSAQHAKVADPLRQRLREFLMTEQVNHSSGYQPLAERVKHSATSDAADSPPNIVLILADDLGYEDLGVHGSGEAQTPNLDAIAAAGIRFTDAYVTAPVCSPSRAGLLTGRYQNRFGFEFLVNDESIVQPDKIVGLDPNETTLADRMKALGYVTGCVGKWHLGEHDACLPTNRGFDEFYGTLGQSSYFEPNLIDSRHGLKAKKVDTPGYYVTDDYSRRAVEFVRQHRDEPFFLFLSHFAVHKPHDATERDLARFPDIQDPTRRAYLAMLAAMDDGIGELMNALRETDNEADTLIVFLSDNGGTQGSSNAPLRGKKGGTWEGGIRVPMLMQWTGHLAKGQLYSQPVISLDLFSTCLAAAGGEADASWALDGVNLLPFLEGTKGGAPHEALFWKFGTQWAIRKGDWKLLQAREGKSGGGSIQIANEGPVRLFHLGNDVSEEVDLAAEKPAHVQKLHQLWQDWSDSLPEPSWVPKPIQ